MRQDWDNDPLRRGETNGGNLAHGTKSAGSLPVNAGSATSSTNTTASSADGAPAFAFHAFLSSGGLDVSVNTKVLYHLMQFNASNRIQVSTKAQDGICFRIGSGPAGTGSPATTYKHYQLGGRDTPFGRQNAGIRACILDLNDVSNEDGAGSFDNTNVTTYGVGTVRHNISGNSSNFYFRQPNFLFDTGKNEPNIPTFTGLSSNFDEFIDAVLGNNFSDIISYDWVVRNGDILNISAPMQIGNGSTATTFDDQGKTIISASSNDPSDPRNRLTTQAMRFYWVPRNNASDTLTMTGTYIWGTAAPFDLDVSNSAIATITDATFNGMGDFTLGSSVSGAATFNLASGSNVRINGANLDGSIINGDCDLVSNGVTTLTNINVSGVLDFDTAGTYTLDGCNISEVTNSSGGTVTINLVNGASIINNSGPNITILNSVTVSFSGIPNGLEARIKKGTFTLFHISSITGESFDYAYNYLNDENVVVTIGGVADDGFSYERQTFSLILTNTPRDVPLEFSINPSYI